MNRPERVAMTPTAVTVYCEGPPDSDGQPTHDRFILPFNRIQMGSRLQIWSDGALWANGTDEGRTRRSNRVLAGDRPGEIGVDTRRSGARGQFRLRCPRCDFDEQRNTRAVKGEVPPEVAAIFDGLVGAGIQEISMRALIKLAYPNG